MKLISIILISFIFLLVVTLKPYKVNTQSMEEVIKPGEIVVTFKSVKWMGVQRGDILAFKKGEDQTTFIKRVYGAPGDTLKLLRNYIKIEDQKIPHDSIFEMMVEESDHPDSTGLFWSANYLKYLVRHLPEKDQLKSLSGKENELIVPEDYFFMVGDNYYESMDSRFWGFIPKENIKGKVILIF